MLRNVLCTALALAVFASFGLAADEAKKKKKKQLGAAVSGEITKVDAEKGTLTVKVSIKKKQTADKEFKVTDKTTVTAVEGDKKTELKGPVAELLKKEEFKTGTNAAIEADEDGTTAKSITLGGTPESKKKKKKTNN